MSRTTQQPFVIGAMSLSDNISNIEDLRRVDSLSINHGFSFRQGLSGVSMRAKYGIFNDQGEQLYSVFEEANLFELICCTNERGFTIRILDNYNREVIRIHRELQRCSGCCWCGSCESCMHQVTVEFPPGNIIGIVQQEGSACNQNYIIKDVNKTPMLAIVGPCCICNGIYSCGCENKYILLGTDQSTEIGAIDKKYPESMKLVSANPVAFTLTFPLDLDVKMKALILGALFLIDVANYRMTRLRS